jgi:hypothetical protein
MRLPVGIEGLSEFATRQMLLAGCGRVLFGTVTSVYALPPTQTRGHVLEIAHRQLGVIDPKQRPRASHRATIRTSLRCDQPPSSSSRIGLRIDTHRVPRVTCAYRLSGLDNDGVTFYTCTGYLTINGVYYYPTGWQTTVNEGTGPYCVP